jgi:cellobiose phosphorylase
MIKSSFGYFDKNGTEFVVTEYDTAIPLINFYWNDRFISSTSQHMAGIGGFTGRPMQYMHPEVRCLMVRDQNRHFYLRDDESGEFWSPGFYPVSRVKPDSFRCRQGLGYSVLEASNYEILTTMRVFVPKKYETEIWSVRLENQSKRPRRISFYSFIDWLLTGYQEYCDYHSSLRGEYDKEIFALNCYNGAPERPHERFSGFIASDTEPGGFDSNRREFIGNLGTVSVPRAVVEGRMANSLVACEKMVGALEHSFELAPGGAAEFNVAIGSTDSRETTREICSNIFAPGAVEKLFTSMREDLTAKYDTVVVDTPDERLNYLFNGWIKRAIQLHTEVGTDTGRGFRDVLQAAWAVSSYDPEGAKQKIVDSLGGAQFADGHTLRSWNPVDDHHYSDGPVWIAPAVDSYLKETGDYDFLDTAVPYFDRGEGTVWEHILAGIRRSSDDLGGHGLILARDGDWNDSLNWMGKGGKGESAWTTIGMIFSINCALDIVRNVIKDSGLEQELIERAARLDKAVQEHAWDGSWYLQGYTDAGEPVGSHTEKEGRVYLNSQTWAILAGIAKGERLESILNAVDNMLECDYGSMVLTPAYTKRNPGIGRLTTFTPGMWENASPYCHGTAFKIMADTFIGRGDQAFDSMMKILPDNPNNPCTHSGCPPYMVTNMYYGPEHPRPGQILYAWLTGAGDWVFKALTSYMIGVRADYQGLLIDPCLPSHWTKASMRRTFRGAHYQVTVQNPEGRRTGVKSILLDSNPVEGNLLPIIDDGKTHEVEVLM